MTAENKIARRPTLGQRYGTLLWVEENKVFWANDMKAKGLEAKQCIDWLVFVNDPESGRYGQVGLLIQDIPDKGGIAIKYTDGKYERHSYSENGWPKTLVAIPKPALSDLSWSELIKRQPGLEQFKT